MSAVLDTKPTSLETRHHSRNEAAIEEAMANITMIYSMLPTQLSYPVNSPTRLAIQESYGYAQARMLAAGISVSVLFVAWVLMIRNLDVSKKSAQTKGMVF